MQVLDGNIVKRHFEKEELDKIGEQFEQEGGTGFGDRDLSGMRIVSESGAKENFDNFKGLGRRQAGYAAGEDAIVVNDDLWEKLRGGTSDLSESERETLAHELWHKADVDNKLRVAAEGGHLDGVPAERSAQVSRLEQLRAAALTPGGYSRIAISEEIDAEAKAKEVARGMTPSNAREAARTWMFGRKMERRQALRDGHQPDWRAVDDYRRQFSAEQAQQRRSFTEGSTAWHKRWQAHLGY